jgi:mycofactocin precursor
MNNTNAPQDVVETVQTQDAAGVEDLLVEEVSIDGMCGVY